MLLHELRDARHICWLQAKTLVIVFSKAHSFICRPFLLGVDPMAIVMLGDGDLTTMKFIHAEVECSSSPIFTSRENLDYRQMVSPLKSLSDVVAGSHLLLIRPERLTKQCSYRTSEDAPPSTYIRCTMCPPILASMVIGPSVPSSSPKDEK
ncbi:hypothetical protein Tco_0004962 [Tanacetum coccineum]